MMRLGMPKAELKDPIARKPTDHQAVRLPVFRIITVRSAP
jgi:hypothetical protein